MQILKDNQYRLPVSLTNEHTLYGVESKMTPLLRFDRNISCRRIDNIFELCQWHQGIEFYNFARRAGRDDFVMLVYPGEDHVLRKKENQIDYHRRINQWFGHWLKGEPAPKWMTDGMTWLERKSVLDSAK